MIRIACLAVAVLSLGACGGSKTTSPGKYDEECVPTAPTPCVAGLLCINKLCTASCTMQSQCQGLGPNASCNAGYCYDLCVDTRNCPAGLVCNMVISTQGTCRPQ
jgi:hypothetical protein